MMNQWSTLLPQLRYRVPAAVYVLAALSLAGCSRESRTEVSEEPPHDPIPEVYRVRFETTKGNFVVEVTKSWAPLGAERFYLLTQAGLWKTQRFYRVLPGNLVQFGLNTLPAEKQHLATVLHDEPVRQSNRRGTLVFTSNGPHTRNLSMLINLRDNTENDVKGQAPIGKVIFGLDVVEGLHSYGEMAPVGSGPNMAQLTNEGVPYLTRLFPSMDYIREAVFTD